MDFIREIVGGPKIRYRKGGYNLDLSYITPRMIAMAYPATGFQKLYRNSVETVCELLESKHNGKYLTINLSNRLVNEKILKNVENFIWEDHKPPSFQVLFSICRSIAEYLLKEPEGVAVIHCNHGKGRTGTLISCFLLYSGVFDSVVQSMRYYSEKRFQEQGHGVTQPCQITYIKYFNKMLINPKLRPQVVHIRRIIFSGGHNLTQPYLKLRNISNNDELFSTKKNSQITLSKVGDKLMWKFSQQLLFAGDFILEIKQSNKMSKNAVGSLSFNTTFVNKTLQATLNDLSPHSLTTSGLFELDFKMEIHFRSTCGCEVNSVLPTRCQKCKKWLSAEQQKFTKIQQALEFRQKQLHMGRQMIAGKYPTLEQFSYIAHKLVQQKQQSTTTSFD